MVTAQVISSASYGFQYYPTLVKVVCGDKQGYFMGGHYNRRRKVQDSDIWVECCCSECRDDPTPGLHGKRVLCRKFEAHGGREAAKKYYESIKAVDKDGNRQSLIKWIQGECKEIGLQMVGHKIRVWWPADNNGVGVYHTGTVASFDDQLADHHIDYEDESAEDLWLAVESWTDLGLDPQWVQPEVPPIGLVSQSVALAEKSLSMVYKQNSQSDVSQSRGLQQSTSGSASDPDYSAEQLSRKQSYSSRGLPSNSDPGKKRRPSIEHAQDLSMHLPDGKAQPHRAPESNKPVPMQANSAVEAPTSPHSHKQQLQQDKQAGLSSPELAPGTGKTPAERSIHDWKEVFSEANVETVSSSNMLKSITEMLKILSNQNNKIGPVLLGRLSSLPAEEKARSIKGLFQGCSELFAFVEDDIAQMKALFLEYFDIAHLTRQALPVNQTMM